MSGKPGPKPFRWTDETVFAAFSQYASSDPCEYHKCREDDTVTYRFHAISKRSPAYHWRCFRRLAVENIPQYTGLTANIARGRPRKRRKPQSQDVGVESPAVAESHVSE